MKKLQLLAVLILITSCDDGDFNVPSFDFNDVAINNCGNMVLHKISSTQTEALIIKLNEDNTDDLFFKTPMTNKSYSLTENGTNSINYRIFNGKVATSYFCQDIPNATPTVSSEWVGTGNLIVNNTITYDDDDLVLSATEDINNDNDLTNDDTDSDGYPNYIDTDDDGDNISTKNEDIDGDGDPTNDDTDSDSIPNYLDTDDDNDGVLSINESKTADDNVNTIPDYLDPDTTKFIDPILTPKNNYKQSYTIIFKFEDALNFSNGESNIKYSNGYSYGTKEGFFTISDLPQATN